MTKDEALRMALDIAEEYVKEHGYGKVVVNAIKEALAEQPENQVDDIDVVDIPAQQCQHAWRNISSKRQTVYQCDRCGIYTFEQPAQQQDIDWKDQYEKQKRRAEMWVAKYEADINPLEKAGPVTAQQQEMVQTEPNFEQRKQILDNLDRCLYQDSKHELLRVWIRDWTNHKLSKQTPPRKPWVGLTDEEVKHQWEVWRANVPRYMGFAKGIEAKLKEKNT